MNESHPIVVSRVYPASPEVVWRAITDPRWMRQWFFETMRNFCPEVGFETEFIVDCEGTGYPHHWKVTEVNQGLMIRYEWNYPGIPGESDVTWELHQEGSDTRLTLTHRGQESFESDKPEFSRESCEGGWTYFLDQSLAKFLNSPPADG